MPFEFKLPDIGEGLVEGEIVRWLVKVGDRVAEDQALAELMTEKATIEIPSPVSGTVTRLLAEEGQVVPVGSVIVHIETGANGEGRPAKKAEKKEEPAEKKEPAPVPAGDEDMPLFSPTKPSKKKPAGGAAKEVSVPSPESYAPPPGAKAAAAPATRRLAREMGVDLSKVPATGSGGRVTAEDVRRYASEGAKPSAGKAAPKDEVRAPAGGERREPIKGIRRKIAEQMKLSKRTAPHFSYMEEVDVTELVSLHGQAKGISKTKGIKLTYTPFFIKAAVEALRQFPIVNSSLDEEKQELVYKGYYNIGIAAHTEQGLIVPVVKNADKLTLFQVAAEVMRLASAAREGKSRLEDLKGGTFTITNVGSIGGLAATPILNVPEVAIMGVGAIKKKPWVVGDRIEPRDILVLSMSFDHRVVDGAVGARFVSVVKEFLENPSLLMLSSS